MQIDNDAAIYSERAEERVLHLQVRRILSTAKSRDDEHHGGESKRRPIVREKRPGPGGGSESTKIRMDGQQGTIGRVRKKILPARADAESVDIEDESTQAKEHTGIEN